MWTHLLPFDNAWSRSHYVTETYNADPELPKSQNYYEQRNVSKNKYFFAQKVADLSFAGVETEIRRFAAEAVQLKQQESSKLLAGHNVNSKKRSLKVHERTKGATSFMACVCGRCMASQTVDKDPRNKRTN